MVPFLRERAQRLWRSHLSEARDPDLFGGTPEKTRNAAVCFQSLSIAFENQTG